jgi:hypothetical protein
MAYGSYATIDLTSCVPGAFDRLTCGVSCSNVLFVRSDRPSFVREEDILLTTVKCAANYSCSSIALPAIAYIRSSLHPQRNIIVDCGTRHGPRHYLRRLIRLWQTTNSSQVPFEDQG